MFKNPINIKWLIIISLVVFSVTPILVLQVWQVMTLPDQFREQVTDRSISEIELTLNLIKNSIESDSKALVSLAENENLNDFVNIWNGSIATVNVTYKNKLSKALLNYFTLKETLPSYLEVESTNDVVEIGYDAIAIENEIPTYLNDNITRLMTITRDTTTDQIHISNETVDISSNTYAPYTSIKEFGGKIQSTSSIVKRIDYTTGDVVLDENGTAQQVTVHSRFILNENEEVKGIVYAMISASPIIKTLESLDSPNLPIFMVDQDGYLLYYQDPEQLYTRVAGYYTVLTGKSSSDVFVDPYGFQDKITIFKQAVVDYDSNQKVVVARVISRAYIFSLAQDAIINGLIVLVIFTSIAILFSIVTTRTITQRLSKLTDAADDISKGNFDVNINTEGSDEISELAKAFDRMNKSLKLLMSDFEEE